MGNVESLNTDSSAGLSIEAGVQPDAQPSLEPNAQPSLDASTQPSTQPSAQPNAQPSVVLTARIKAYALEIGYSRVGITSADDFTEFVTFITAREENCDWWIANPIKPLSWAHPKEMIPNTKSLIVLVYDYAQKQFPARLCTMLGRIYQSRSYFAPPTNINGARLELLRQYLAQHGIESTDAPWIPQRWAGYRAGLTTFGRNTFAYASELGSFIVLSVLAVDVELDYDEAPAADSATCLCPKNCRRCIDACPTGALGEPFNLDARRCIAFNNWMPAAEYVPRDIRPLMSQRIHGCDACQEVCSRNQAILAANDKRPTDSLLEWLNTELDLVKLLHLDDAYYETHIRPVMYNYIRNHRFFQRNAAIALGNTHDPAYVSELVIELSNDSPMIRAHVVWALGEIGTPDALAALKKHQPNEDDEHVLEELRLVLF